MPAPLSLGALAVSPEVSSYTCIEAVSPSSLIISPTSFSCPTRTSSYIAAPLIRSPTTTIEDEQSGSAPGKAEPAALALADRRSYRS